MNLTSVNDAEILQEYVRRFTIKAGDGIKTSRGAADHFRAFFSDASKREHFVVCFCNGQNCVLKTETMFVGSLTTSAIYVRELIQRILELGAASILVAHNHPSGSITPSSSDRAVTKRIQSAVSTIEVEILDHIIIGGDEYFSFADAGLL